MGFTSIQTKYLLLVSLCVLASSLLIGVACVHAATQISLREAAQTMNLTCESYVNRYDISLKNTQDTVEATAAFAEEVLESAERLASDDSYRAAYAQRLEDAMRTETFGSTDVTSYYVRFSPDLLPYEQGFRYVRTSDANDTGAFEKASLVRIQDYAQDDLEHVGWYYMPIEAGTTTWLAPYYNANFEQLMVSCVAPFYKEGKLVGIIGMDIGFSELVDDLRELRIFDNGYAFLCSAEGEIYYHPLYERGSFIQEDVVGFDAQLKDESSGELLYQGISRGEEVCYAFRTLTNGMRLVLRAPEAEMSADAHSLVATIVVLMALITALSTAVTVLVSRRITKPLSQLTEAARQMSQGNYDLRLSIRSNDEVGVLAQTLQSAAGELKASSDYMRQLAYRDPLTGVRNKTAYDREVASLEKAMADGGARFALAVFDVNDLKGANDTYGHEQGDKVIRTACSRICRTFAESPVFRIGGDEFVAILQGSELARADALLRVFERRGVAENSVVESPQDIVEMAAGIAVYNPVVDTTVQDVFNRADAKMYEAKQAMKAPSEEPDESEGSPDADKQ